MVSPSQQKVAFEKLNAWSAEAEQGLSRCFPDTLELERVREHVNAGRFELYRINGGRAWMVTRVDGDVLTICCLQGCGARVIAEHVMPAARSKGIRSIGFIVQTRALGRMLRSFGVQELGTIFSVNL